MCVRTILVNEISQKGYGGFWANFSQMSTLTQGWTD